MILLFELGLLVARFYQPKEDESAVENTEESNKMGIIIGGHRPFLLYRKRTII